MVLANQLSDDDAELFSNASKTSASSIKPAAEMVQPLKDNSDHHAALDELKSLGSGVLASIATPAATLEKPLIDAGTQGIRNYSDMANEFNKAGGVQLPQLDASNIKNFDPNSFESALKDSAASKAAYNVGKGGGDIGEMLLAPEFAPEKLTGLIGKTATSALNNAAITGAQTNFDPTSMAESAGATFPGALAGKYLGNLFQFGIKPLVGGEKEAAQNAESFHNLGIDTKGLDPYVNNNPAGKDFIESHILHKDDDYTNKARTVIDDLTNKSNSPSSEIFPSFGKSDEEIKNKVLDEIKNQHDSNLAESNKKYDDFKKEGESKNFDLAPYYLKMIDDVKAVDVPEQVRRGQYLPNKSSLDYNKTQLKAIADDIGSDKLNAAIPDSYYTSKYSPKELISLMKNNGKIPGLDISNPEVKMDALENYLKQNGYHHPLTELGEIDQGLNQTYKKSKNDEDLRGHLSVLKDRLSSLAQESGETKPGFEKYVDAKDYWKNNVLPFYDKENPLSKYLIKENSKTGEKTLPNTDDMVKDLVSSNKGRPQALANIFEKAPGIKEPLTSLYLKQGNNKQLANPMYETLKKNYGELTPESSAQLLSPEQLDHLNDIHRANNALFGLKEALQKTPDKTGVNWKSFVPSMSTVLPFLGATAGHVLSHGNKFADAGAAALSAIPAANKFIKKPIENAIKTSAIKSGGKGTRLNENTTGKIAAALASQ